jgi:hypothetical protein
MIVILEILPRIGSPRSLVVIRLLELWSCTLLSPVVLMGVGVGGVVVVEGVLVDGVVDLVEVVNLVVQALLLVHLHLVPLLH